MKIVALDKPVAELTDRGSEGEAVGAGVRQARAGEACHPHRAEGDDARARGADDRAARPVQGDWRTTRRVPDPVDQDRRDHGRHRVRGGPRVDGRDERGGAQGVGEDARRHRGARPDDGDRGASRPEGEGGRERAREHEGLPAGVRRGGRIVEDRGRGEGEDDGQVQGPPARRDPRHRRAGAQFAAPTK